MTEVLAGSSGIARKGSDFSRLRLIWMQLFRAAVVVTTTLTLVFCVGPGQAWAAGQVHLVDDDGQDCSAAAYRTISEALSVAADGDTIVVFPGIYNENVTVSKRVYLEGLRGPASTEVRAADKDRHVFHIKVEGVVLSGFTISGATGEKKAGVVIEANGCEIFHNVVRDNCCGLVIVGGNSNRIWGNTFIDNKYGAGTAEGGSGSGGCAVEEAARLAQESGTASFRTSVAKVENTLTALRLLRDRALKSEYVELYYRLSPAIKKTLLSHPGLAVRMFWLLAKYAPAISAVVDTEAKAGNDPQLTPAEVAEVQNFLDDFIGAVQTDARLSAEERQMLVSLADELREEAAQATGKRFSEAFRNSRYYRPLTVSPSIRYEAGGGEEPGNYFYLNDFLRNQEPVGAQNPTIWHMPEAVRYRYGEGVFTGYLGNYYDVYTGTDEDGDGVGDQPYEVPGSTGGRDDYPLVQPSRFYRLETVPRQLPVASFRFTPANPVAGQEIIFDASASYDPDGQIVSYQWDLGDGVTVQGKMVTHVYFKAGSYQVTLTVADNDGLADSVSQTVYVGQDMIREVKMYIGNHCLASGAVFLNGVDLEVNFVPEIDWGSESPGTVKYVTPKGTYIEKGAKTFNVGSEFGAGGKLEVVAVSKNGKESAPYTVPFEVAPAPLGQVWSFDKANLKYSWGGTGGAIFYILKEEIGGARIPTTIPIYGGKKIEISYLLNCMVEVDLKGKGSLLFKAKEWSEDNYISYAGKRVPLVEKKKGRRAHLAKGESLEVSVMPGICFSYDPQEKSWRYGSLGLEIEGFTQTPPHYTVVMAGPVPIPLYARLGAGINMYNQLDLLCLDLKDSSLNPTWEGNFDLCLYGKVMGGVGAADIASAELYGKGGPEAKFHYPEEPHLESLCINLECGVTVVILIYHHDFKLWDHHWCLEEGEGARFSSWTVSELTPLPRDYLDKRPYARFYRQGARFSAQDISPQSEPAQEVLLQENVYPYSQPVIVSQNGEAYAFWLYDDPARESLNRTELVFSRYAEGGWSVPQAVYDDGTADFHSQAAFLPDGRVLVAWENVKEKLPDNATLEDMVAKIEIAYAIYDPATGSWEAGSLTNNGFFDHSPKLAAGEDGTALLIWTENKGNKLFGSGENPDNLAYALWDGNNWTAFGEIAVVSNPVIKSTLAYNGTKGLVIWESDEDTDLSTLRDRELRMLQFEKGIGWGEEELLTANEYPDLAPQVLFDGDTPVLLWLRDSDLVMARELDLTDATIAVEDMQSPGGTSFKAAKRDKGLLLFWSGLSTEGVDIYVTYWDRTYNTWGKPIQITRDDSLERDISGCSFNGSIYGLIYDKVKVTYTEEGLPKPEKTDLCFLRYREGIDLCLNYISLTNQSPAVGEELTITAEVANLGETVEEDIPVLFYNGNPVEGGELIGSASLAGPLSPGEFGGVGITWQVPHPGKFTLYAAIDPQFAPGDRDRANDENQVEITVSAPRVKGDVNGDGTVDILDVVKAVNFALGRAVPTEEERYAADVNDDGVIDILDVVRIVNIALGRG